MKWFKRKDQPKQRVRPPYGENMLEAIAKGEVTAQLLPNVPTTQEIQFLHKQMFTEFLPNAGLFRDGNRMVEIGAFPVAPPQRIKREFALLEAQMDRLSEESMDEKALKLAFYHLRFEAIHPFLMETDALVVQLRRRKLCAGWVQTRASRNC